MILSGKKLYFASKASLSKVEGFVENVSSEGLKGWIWDPSTPEYTLCVEVFGPSMFYGRTIADVDRQDLRVAGKRGGQCGFRIPLPSHLLTESVDQCIVMLDGTSHRVRRVGDTSDKLIENWLDQQGGDIHKQVLVQRNCYDILGRAPTVEELGQWMPLASNALSSLSTLVRTIASLRRLDSGVLGGVNTEAVVRNVYLGVLKREAEPRGIEIYSEALRNGLSLADLIGELIKTPEFMSKVRQPIQNSEPVEFQRLAAAMERAVLTLAIGAAAQNDKPGICAQPSAIWGALPDAAALAPGDGRKVNAKAAAQGRRGALLNQATLRP